MNKNSQKIVKQRSVNRVNQISWLIKVTHIFTGKKKKSMKKNSATSLVLNCGTRYSWYQSCLVRSFPPLQTAQKVCWSSTLPCSCNCPHSKLHPTSWNLGPFLSLPLTGRLEKWLILLYNDALWRDTTSCGSALLLFFLCKETGSFKSSLSLPFIFHTTGLSC